MFEVCVVALLLGILAVLVLIYRQGPAAGGIVATQADLDHLHSLAEKLKTIDPKQEGPKP